MADAGRRLEGETYDLTIVREFDAPRELVFQMWTDPRHTINWMGPRDYPAVVFEQDVRVGGKWRGCLTGTSESDHPGGELWQGGEYLEVDPPEKLVFTFAWEDGPDTVVTVILTDAGNGKTRMVFHQTPFETQSNRDGHSGGWNSSFDRLVSLLTAPTIRAQFGEDAIGRVTGVEADLRAAEQRHKSGQAADGNKDRADDK